MASDSPAAICGTTQIRITRQEHQGDDGSSPRVIWPSVMSGAMFFDHEQVEAGR
jgi:hypothetical protein